MIRVVFGVCLFFENSTGCYLSQVPIIDHPLDDSFGDGQIRTFICRGLIFCRVFEFFLESLILAQDERWRRA